MGKSGGAAVIDALVQVPALDKLHDKACMSRVLQAGSIHLHDPVSQPCSPFRVSSLAEHCMATTVVHCCMYSAAMDRRLSLKVLLQNMIYEGFIKSLHANRNRKTESTCTSRSELKRAASCTSRLNASK